MLFGFELSVEIDKAKRFNHIEIVDYESVVGALLSTRLVDSVLDFC